MDELMRECSIGANYLHQNGCVFFGTYWKEEKTRVFRDITIDEIARNLLSLLGNSGQGSQGRG